MWWNHEKKFMYFFPSRFTLCNNNQLDKKFNHKPWSISLEHKQRWETNGDSIRLSPETLTYWNEE